MKLRPKCYYSYLNDKKIFPFFYKIWVQNLSSNRWIVSFVFLMTGLLWSCGRSPLIFWCPVSFDLLVAGLLWSSGDLAALIFWCPVFFDLLVTGFLWYFCDWSPVMFWWSVSFDLVAAVLCSSGGRSPLISWWPVFRPSVDFVTFTIFKHHHRVNFMYTISFSKIEQSLYMYYLYTAKDVLKEHALCTGIYHS